MKHHPRRYDVIRTSLCLIALFGVATTSLAVPVASIQFNGAGFTDATPLNPVDHPGLPSSITTVGAARSYVLQAAADHVMSNLETGYAGETIRFTALFEPQTGTVGTASPADWRPGSDFANGMANVMYPLSLANRVAGSEVFTGVHINSQFNSNTTFSFSTTQPPTVGGGIESLYATAAHEFLHGLGFFGGVSKTGEFEIGGNPTIFDKQILAGATPLTSLNQTDRAAAMIGSNLTLNGTAILAPSPFEDGSSGSHWARGSGNFMMLPEAPSGMSETLVMSSVDIGAMRSIGWTATAIPEPSACIYGLVVCGLVGIGRRRQLRMAEKNAEPSTDLAL